MDDRLYIKIEEYLNNTKCRKNTPKYFEMQKIDPAVVSSINRRMKQESDTLYDFIIEHIKKLNKTKYIRKNGNINEPAFYNEAFIDKSTWSNIRLNKTIPSKETLLKLIIALRLNEAESNELMAKGHNSLDPNDPRDLVMLALIDIRCYDPVVVYEVLEEYGKNGVKKFHNIYGDD